MLKRLNLIAFVGIVLCLVAAPLVSAQDARYDILYATLDEDTTGYDVRVVNAASRQISNIETLHVFGSDAGWSPDGRFIYLVDNTQSKTRTLTLVKMEDGSRQIVTDQLLPPRCTSPLWWWSPDGRSLVVDHKGS